MRILILGGTVFLGRHLVDAALAMDHTVTIFHRGLHAMPDFPGHVEEIFGDRTESLDALAGREWDIVIDTSGYVPRHVRANAKALRSHVNQYIFVSTISVYPTSVPPNADESFPVLTLPDPSIETVNGESYGPLKALCELAVQDVFGTRATIVRPGLIVGPHDPTYRFTYWVERMKRDGEVLAPVGPDEPVQFIDVRDLAEWIIKLAENSIGGLFNATGPDYPLTMGEVLTAMAKVSGNDSIITWVSEEFLTEHGVEPWSDLPLWVPQSTMPGFLKLDCKQARDAGLRYRTLTQTVRDTLDWSMGQLETDTPRLGLKADREKELLQRWHPQEMKER